MSLAVPVGTTNALNSLTISGVTTLSSGATTINTLLNQSYNNGLTLGVGTTLRSINGGDISFGTSLIPATISGAASLAINTSVTTPGNVTFWGAVGGTPLTSLNVFGSSINLHGGTVTTSGAQTYNSLVTLFANTTLTSSGNALNLLGNVTSDTTPRNLTLTAASPTVLTGNLGTPNLLNALTITNASTIGAAIHTLGAQTFGGAMTLSANTSFTADSGDVTISSTVNGGNNTLTISNTGASSAINGIISNLSDLIMAGTGTLTLTANNSYTGTTHINSGILRIGNGGATGLLGSGTVTNNGSLIFNRNNSLTIAGVIEGTGSVTQAGTGTTILSNNNTYSGGTTISSGTLQIGAGGATGAITGAIVNNSALVFNTSNNFTLSNTISGSGSLTQSGTGVVTISGINSYSGQTTVNSGTISFNSIGDAGTDTALGNSSASINLGGTGTLQYTGTGHSSTRVITLTGAGGTLDASGSGALSLSGGITGAGFGLVLTGSGAGTQSGVIATTSGMITKNGSGSWTLSGANTYDGATLITSGTLIAGNDTALGSTVGSTTVSSGATLQLNAVNIGAESLTLNGVGASSNGALVGNGVSSYAGNITLASDTFISHNANLTLSGNIGESGGSRALTKSGTSSLSLSGTNTYSGGTTINSGTIYIVQAVQQVQ